jgi:hypothetical protein
LAQAIGQAAILQDYKVLYRETHVLLDELADAVTDGTRKEYIDSISTVPLLIIDDFGMRKLPHTAAEDLLEIIMRRYEHFSTLPIALLRTGASCSAMSPAVNAMLDRLLHHGHVLKCGPRSWRTKTTAASPPLFSDGHILTPISAEMHFHSQVWTRDVIEPGLHTQQVLVEERARVNARKPDRLARIQSGAGHLCEPVPGIEEEPLIAEIHVA